MELATPQTDASPAATEGTGNVKPIGNVKITGTLTETNDGGGGDLTLNGQRGSVNLTFYARFPSIARGLPKFYFNVDGGTGAYSGASGHGTMNLKLGAQPGVGFKLHGTMRPA